MQHTSASVSFVLKIAHLVADDLAWPERDCSDSMACMQLDRLDAASAQLLLEEQTAKQQQDAAQQARQKARDKKKRQKERKQVRWPVHSICQCHRYKSWLRTQEH